MQHAIYLAGGAEWPLSPEEWEERARSALPVEAYDYVAGGAGSEQTMRANREAFARHPLRPRMLVGTAERDLSVDLLGLRSPAPFLLAPVGVLSIVHPEADLALARASAATGVPFVLSSAASVAMEDVAAVAGGTGRWFQLYWFNDRELAASLVQRAEGAGYGAIVLTVDTLALGWRDRDLRRGYLPFLTGNGLAHCFSDPVFRSRLEATPEDDVVTASLSAIGLFSNLALTWADLEWLRGQTSLPILIKGVLTAEDARLAADHGAAGVVVSNHGGRQVDGTIATLDALGEVREAVGDDYAVLLDGGIRRGPDVLKALALGADAVLLGRPIVYGLAVGGAQGIEAVVRQLAGELDLTMALCGVRTARDVPRSLVAPG
jgi:isopentenyl diphosphate isomerase/L-lactate dehydrogenase-like FMN-dependent dehydrogenase